MTTILQISDPHVVEPGALVSGRLATDQSLRRLVARLTDMLDRIGPVDALLISGDVSDDGSAESYAHFKSLMAPFDLPIFVIPGNHDLREPMRQAFGEAGVLPTTGKLNWHRAIGEVEMIGLDTLIEGHGGGEMDAETLHFLETALATTADRPVLLALHHPPFQTNIEFMDRIGLQGIDPLAKILSNHRGEVRAVCGHVHSMMIASIGGKTAISSPSPCSSFEFDMRLDAPVGFFDHEDGCLLHRWKGGFQSIRIAMKAGNGPFPF